LYPVNYHRASSVAEAAKLLENGEAKLLSGGMTLIPAMKTRLAAPSDVVDIGRIADLKDIKVSGKSVTVGAAATHAEVASNAEMKKLAPAVAELASLIGDPHVRHKGTIGGSVANNDPAADYPAALLALNATIVTNTREIAADGFFTGLFETVLEEGEIITAVRFEAPEKAAYEKFRNPASRYAIAGVFVAKGPAGVRLTVTGAGENGVFRLNEMEAALARNFAPSAVEGISVPSDGLMSDIHASAEYRANLVKVMAKRAVAKAE